MKIGDTHGRWIVSIAVALLLVVGDVQADSQRDVIDVKTLPSHSQSTSSTAENADRIDPVELDRLKRLRNENSPVDREKTGLFRAKSWYVPPPPPPPPPPALPPPPTAPPLPFTFLGQMQEAQGKLTIFLANGNRLYLVAPGETIDSIYSVDGIADGKLGLTYLPLNIKQYLSVGEAP